MDSLNVYIRRNWWPLQKITCFSKSFFIRSIRLNTVLGQALNYHASSKLQVDTNRATEMPSLWHRNKKTLFSHRKSRLRRVRNCMGELALRFETVASFYVCQPNHSYSHFMFSLHSDLTHANVVTDVLHCVWSELPHQGNTLQYYS